MKQTMIILFLSIVGGQPVGAGDKAYTNGLFILNEDWFGHNNSTISFLDPVAGTFDYDLIGNNADNGNQSLGCTAQFGTIYGDHIYLIAKQDQDPGERHATGGRLVVADAKTFKIKKRMARIAEKDGRSMADGRSFVGVDETKGYIGTSNGIYILNLTSLEITGSIADTGNPLIVGDENNSAGIGALYQNQIGTMLRTHDYVFAIQQDRGVLVINPATDRIETVIAGCFSTMTQSKDGTIWVGKNSNANYQTYPYGNHGSSGEEWEGNQLLKINPATLETRLIDLPSPVGINQTWYAWTAGSLCASAQHNRLYFTFNPDKWSWFACSLLYRYDIDDDAFVQLYDSSPEERYFYGAGIRINPLDDKLYASLYLDNISQSYFFYQMDSDGGKLREYEPIARYWFPALFIFPDNHAPEVGEWSPVTITNTEPFTLDLSNLATDRDK
jgi:dipeptidyl aminopeptidase/acylaminoacyl peptidase